MDKMNIKGEMTSLDKVSIVEKTGKKKDLPKHMSPSMKIHRKQAFWQIVFPFIIGCLILIGLGVSVTLVSSSNGDISVKWANISLIVMIIFAGMLGLLGLGLIIGGIYGIAKLIHYTPIYTQIAQTYIYRGSTLIIEYANHSVKPVYFIQSGQAGFKAFINWLAHSNPTHNDDA